jgi:hypothetical protein
MHDERGTMQTQVFDVISKGYKALENHALYPAKCQLLNPMRKKYMSIQFLNTGAKLLATRGPNLSKFC